MAPVTGRPPLLPWIRAQLDRLVTLVLMLGGVAVLLMIAHVTLDVLSRTFLNWPLPGTTLIVSEYYMVACAFLPLAYAERIGGHISMDALSAMASPRVQRIQTAAGYAFSSVVFGLLTWTAWLDAMKKYRLGAFEIEFGTRIPVWPAYFLLPLGAGLLCVLVVVRLAFYLAGDLEAVTTSADDLSEV